MQVDIALTKPQEDFCFSDKKNVAFVGGLGSGKSRAGTIRLVLLIIKNPGSNGAYYMPTYDLIKLRAIPGVMQDLDFLGIGYSVNKSDYKIEINGLGFIIFRSYDNPERIIAYEVANSIVDELDTLEKEKARLVWRKVSERNRQKIDGKNSIGCVTTPDQGDQGFVYERWVTESDDSCELIQASTDSNPFLPEDYIDDILRNYDPVLAKLYTQGEFVSLTRNKVYHFFDKNRHCISKDDLFDDWIVDKTLHIGIDFNIGGCCAVVFIEDGDSLIAINEFSSYDTRDFINNISSIYEENNNSIYIYPDSSGGNNTTNASASDIEIIENEGFFVDCPNKNPFVRDRVNSVNGLLSKNRFKIIESDCPNLVKSLQSQGYDKHGKPEKYDKHPGIDDWLDAAGYLINRIYPIERPTTTFKTGYV